MTRRKREIPLLGAINPDQLYRTTLAPAIFNLGWQACKNKIKSGDLPRPSPLTPGSKYEAWTGQQILDHRKDMQALAAFAWAVIRHAGSAPWRSCDLAALDRV